MTSGSQRDKNPEQNQTMKGVKGSSSLPCPGLEQVSLGTPLPAGPRGFHTGRTHVHTRTPTHAHTQIHTHIGTDTPTSTAHTVTPTSFLANTPGLVLRKRLQPQERKDARPRCTLNFPSSGTHEVGTERLWGIWQTRNNVHKLNSHFFS